MPASSLAWPRKGYDQGYDGQADEMESLERAMEAGRGQPVSLATDQMRRKLHSDKRFCLNGDVHGMCIACAWLCMACAWHVHVACACACAWHVHGMCMACAWHVHGMCMACAWHVHGMCMACAWHVHGMCMCMCMACA